jgi:hypothetical protein
VVGHPFDGAAEVVGAVDPAEAVAQVPVGSVQELHTLVHFPVPTLRRRGQLVGRLRSGVPRAGRKGLALSDLTTVRVLTGLGEPRTCCWSEATDHGILKDRDRSPQSWW